MSPIRSALVAAGLVASVLAPGSAFAMRDGGSDTGDSYLNDQQRNPRLIEPGAYNDPTRYRISNPQAGYEDRELARQGLYKYGSGLPAPRPYRGTVTVTPSYAR